MLSKASTEKLISLSNDLRPQHQTVLTPQAKAALVKSIAHWRDIVKSVAGTGPVKPSSKIDTGPYACALCEVFMIWKPMAKQCVGCPVSQKTGKPSCVDSPYIDARNAYATYFQTLWNRTSTAQRRKTAYENTKKELDFLESLLADSNTANLALYEQNLKSVNTLIKEAGKLKDTILVYLDKHGHLPPGEQAPIKSIRKTKEELLAARWDVECEAATISLPPPPVKVKVKVIKPKPKPIVHPPHVLKAIKALEDSIAHWQRLTDNKATSKDLPVGGTTCALCKLYYATDVRPCFSCPVKIKTGRSSCINTPYIRAASSYVIAKNKPGGRAQARKDGQAEVNFLKEVLRDVKSGKIIIPPPTTGKIKWRI